MAILRWGSASHEGQLRAQNEDHAHAGEGLFVVADGMGGHLAGEIASEMAVERLDQRLPMTSANTLDDVVAAIGEANTEIYQGSIDDPDRAGMGTTVTALAVVSDPHDGEAFAVANVGDSRSYVLRHGRLRQLTIDHSFVQELVAEGAITRDEARTHPRRNIVTRALGIEPYVRVDSWTMPIIRGDRFVLCSDGLVDEITDDAITDVLRQHADDPEAAAQALVDAANDAGGRDNITVVIVDVIEGDDPPDPTEEFDVVPVWHDGDLDSTGETEIVADPPDDDEDGDDQAEDDGDDEGRDATALYDGGDDVTPAPGVAVPILDPDTDATPTDATKPKRKRLARLARFMLAVGVAAVLILGFAIFAAWARSGYFVAFDDDGQVVIYQGREDSVLWFDPTREAFGPFRDELDDDKIALVEEQPNFESQASAERFVSERLTPTTTEPDE
ncbi:MAG: Stp1/IreP family PP2C-type Ser/Thr phosphatase [Ilumatobacteraceae bacterium]|nr:Stp1/IreP family PP2C-type Ser/Thr phosphatase [Ilumatobacteraceae bacterium]